MVKRFSSKMKKTYIAPEQLVCRLQTTGIIMAISKTDKDADPTKPVLTKEFNVEDDNWEVKWDWDKLW